MVGNKLKELRIKNKYSISKLCELIGLNQNTYTKYERNERDVSTETLAKFADFYQVTTDYLLDREPVEQSPVDDLARDFNMTALEKKILEGYLDLPDDMRGDLMDFLYKAVSDVQAEND